GNSLFQGLEESITKAAQPDLLSCHFFEGNLHRPGEPGDAGDIKRAGPQSALVATAVNHRFEQNAGVAAAPIKGADSFWAVDLVRRARQQINIRRLNIKRDMAQSLRRICHEDDVVR